MTAFTAAAPGKIILAGEHAVVYGQPALAVPIHQLQARAVVRADLKGPAGQVWIHAPQVEIDHQLTALAGDHPLRRVVEETLTALEISSPPPLHIQISSQIPIAAGMGSGAAVSTAVIRALSAFLGQPLPDSAVSDISFEVEKIHHGTPSGIDNTVIAYEKPVFYIQGDPIQTLSIGRSFTLVIGDSGIPSPTGETVGAVRQGWKADPAPYETVFQEIGQLVKKARQALEGGEIQALGRLLDENHRLLIELEVSSPALDNLVHAARAAGAWGAKLSGGGRGGNMIAVVKDELAERVAQALQDQGAADTLISRISADRTHVQDDLKPG